MTSVHRDGLVIEPATIEDVPALSELLALLFAQEAEFKPDPEAHCRGLTQIINTPHLGLIYVARQHGMIVGTVNLLFTISTALGERVALLEDLVVLPASRGNGIGSALLAHASAVARQHSCARVTLITDADNFAAQELYKKHGFIKSNMKTMRLMLR